MCYLVHISVISDCVYFLDHGDFANSDNVGVCSFLLRRQIHRTDNEVKK